MTEKKKRLIEIVFVNEEGVITETVYCIVLYSLPSEDKDDETMCTFVLHNEDHTLGNSLRYMILKNPVVEFCGYSIPHPSENCIHLRIQTYKQNNTTAVDVLKKGLHDLSDVCSHMLLTFKEEVAHYKANHPSTSHSTAS